MKLNIFKIFFILFFLVGCANNQNTDQQSEDYFNKNDIDFECLNICKQTVKGGMTISQLNAFCKSQCPIK